MAVYGVVLAAQGPVLPALQAAFHVSPAQLGTLLASSSLGATAAALIGGPLIDRLGTRLLLAIGCGGIALCSLLFAASPNYPLAAIALLLLGMSGGLTDGSVNALVADLFPSRSAVAMALIHLCFGIGALIGPAYAGWLVGTTLGWRAVYGGIGIAALVVTVILWREHHPVGRLHVGSSPAELIRLLFTRTVLVSALALGLYVAAEIGLSSWLVYYLVTVRRIDLFLASLVLSLFWGSIVIGRLACSWAALHLPPATIVWMSAIMAVVAYVGVAVLTDPRWLYVAVAVAGIGCAGQFPMIMAWATAKDPARTGAVAGLLIAGADLGGSVGSWTVGLVATNAGLTGVSGLSLGILMLAGALAGVALLFRRLDMAERAATSGGSVPRHGARGQIT